MTNLEEFINRRKNDWLTRKIKEGKENELVLKQQANENFSIKNWIENASLRANQLHLVSHVAKLSHPDAKASAFVASCPKLNDGLIRTGNVNYEHDVYGNAAALDVYQFLSLPFNEEINVLEAFEKKVPALVQYVTNLGLDFETIRSHFLEIKNDSSQTRTSPLLKQVYFPIDSEHYHLLSIVNPTGLMQTLNNRIRNMRKEGQDNREKIKNGTTDSVDFQRLSALTKIGYGGSKPQNISSINNKEHGVFFLLPSLPPELSKKYLRLPTEDFFHETLNYRQPEFISDFKSLDKCWNTPINNMQNRRSILYYLEHIIDRILLVASYYQALPAGWSESLENLPTYQKVWLDCAFENDRGEVEWREKVAERMAAWIIFSWEKIAQTNKFGDDQFKELRKLVMSEKEVF